MEAELWPVEYQIRVNEAVELCTLEGVGSALASLKAAEERFSNHPSFADRESELKRSILRNVILVLTLSNENSSRLALVKLLNDSSSLEVFEEAEQRELRRAIFGKLSGENWLDS